MGCNETLRSSSVSPSESLKDTPLSSPLGLGCFPLGFSPHKAGAKADKRGHMQFRGLCDPWNPGHAGGNTGDGADHPECDRISGFGQN